MGVRSALLIAGGNIRCNHRKNHSQVHSPQHTNIQTTLKTQRLMHACVCTHTSLENLIPIFLCIYTMVCMLLIKRGHEVKT